MIRSTALAALLLGGAGAHVSARAETAASLPPAPMTVEQRATPQSGMQSAEDATDDAAAALLERLRLEHPAAYFRQQEAFMTDDPVTQLYMKRLLDQYGAAVADRAELQLQRQRAMSGYVEAGTRVQSLQDHLATLVRDIYDAEISLRQSSEHEADLQRQIVVRQLQIARFSEQAAQQELVVRAYLRALDTSMSRSALEVLLTSETFAQAVDESSSLDAVKQAGARSIEQLRTLQQRIGAERTALEGDQRTIAELRASLAEQRAYLRDQRREKELLLVRTQGQQSLYAAIVEEAQAKQALVERELQDVTDALTTLADPTALQGLGLQPAASSEGVGPVSDAGYIWPVPPLKITTFFHEPEYVKLFGFAHEGVDIRAAQGSEVRAAADGVVFAARDRGKGYSFVVLLHRDQRQTVYGHLSRIDVKDGAVVHQGDVIGLSGGAVGGDGSGVMTTGPHLHFETREDGHPINPLDVLP